MPKHRLTDERFRELFGFDRLKPKGKVARPLSAPQLEKTFGVRPAPRLSRTERRRAHNIDLMFIDMYMYYGKSSLAVFVDAARGRDMSEGEARALHSHMLHHLSECPRFVVEYMRAELAPKRLKQQSAHFKPVS